MVKTETDSFWKIENEYVTRSADETEAVGEQLARALNPGDVVALFGDLGSGKTCLIRGVARGLGYSEPVTSPTFTLVHEYQGRCPLYHFDCYRLNSDAEVRDLGLDDYFFSHGVSMVEWAEKILVWLPEPRWEVRLEIPDDHSRRIIIQPPHIGARI